MPVEHAVLLLKTELKGGRATNKHQLKVASVTQHFMISTHSRPIKRNPYIYVSLINYFWVLGDSKWATVCKNAGTHWSWRSTLQSDIDIWFKIHRGGSTKNTPQKITIQKPMDLILNVAINSWTITLLNATFKWLSTIHFHNRALICVAFTGCLQCTVSWCQLNSIISDDSEEIERARQNQWEMSLTVYTTRAALLDLITRTITLMSFVIWMLYTVSNEVTDAELQSCPLLKPGDKFWG